MFNRILGLFAAFTLIPLTLAAIAAGEADTCTETVGLIASALLIPAMIFWSDDLDAWLTSLARKD